MILLNKSWRAKKEISGDISNTEVNIIISDLKGMGMIGGKLLGSGGSGFIFALCKDVESRKTIESKYKTEKVEIDWNGSIVCDVANRQIQHYTG